jgi:hypothetical protein
MFTFEIHEDVFNSPCANRFRNYSLTGSRDGQDSLHDTPRSLSRHSSLIEDWCETPPLRSLLIDDEADQSSFIVPLSLPSTKSPTADISPYDSLTYSLDDEHEASQNQVDEKGIEACTEVLFDAHPRTVDGSGRLNELLKEVESNLDNGQALTNLLDTIDVQDMTTDESLSSITMTGSSIALEQQQNNLPALRLAQDVDATQDGGGGGGDEARLCEKVDKGGQYRGSFANLSSFVENYTEGTPYSHANQVCDSSSRATPTTNKEPSLLVLESDAQAEYSLHPPHAQQRSPLDAFSLAFACRQNASSHQSALPGTVTPHRLSKRQESSVVRSDNLSEVQVSEPND